MDNIESSYFDASTAAVCQQWETGIASSTGTIAPTMTSDVHDFSFDNEFLTEGLGSMLSRTATSLNAPTSSFGSHHLMDDDDDDEDLFTRNPLEMMLDDHNKQVPSSTPPVQEQVPTPPPLTEIKQEVVQVKQEAVQVKQENSSTTMIKQELPIKQEVVQAVTKQPIVVANLQAASSTGQVKALPKIFAINKGQLKSGVQPQITMIKHGQVMTANGLQKIVPIQRVAAASMATIHKINGNTPIRLITTTTSPAGNVSSSGTVTNASQIQVCKLNTASVASSLGGSNAFARQVIHPQKINISKKITINSVGTTSANRFATASGTHRLVAVTQHSTNLQQQQRNFRAVNPCHVFAPTTLSPVSHSSSMISFHPHLIQRKQSNNVMLISRPASLGVMNNTEDGYLNPTSSSIHTKLMLKDKRILPEATCLRIVLSNVVARLSVGCHLNLRKIATQSYDVELKRERQKVVMKMKNPKCTAYMWSSGKIVCTGSTSADNSRRSARKFVKRLKRIGCNAKFSKYKIVNVLASAKMPFEIDITRFSREHRGPHCSYEPELHCGVNFKERETKASLKIFSTGSITVAARSVERARQGIRNLYPILKPYYKLEKENNLTDVFNAPYTSDIFMLSS